MAEPVARPAEQPGIQFGRVFGIPLYLSPSWFIIFFLTTGLVATQFTSQHPGWSREQHWALGIVTSFLFFASVVFHELSHSVVAKHYKIPVQSITLFVFGGLSRITREPDNGKQEFNVAIAGPLSSFFLAGCFWLVWRYSASNEMVHAASGWLWQINLGLAIFNLVPGFPLDGGRVLRGIVWGITGDFTRATKIAANAGKFFAYLMIFIGVYQALHGNWVGGLWLAFIGWFLLSAAQESYSSIAVRNMLVGVRAEDIMTRDVPTVTRYVDRRICARGIAHGQPLPRGDRRRHPGRPGDAGRRPLRPSRRVEEHFDSGRDAARRQNPLRCPGRTRHEHPPAYAEPGHQPDAGDFGESHRRHDLPRLNTPPATDPPPGRPRSLAAPGGMVFSVSSGFSPCPLCSAFVLVLLWVFRS